MKNKDITYRKFLKDEARRKKIRNAILAEEISSDIPSFLRPELLKIVEGLMK